MPSIPSSIPDTQLGLTQSELHILRQHQQIALSAQPTPTASHTHSLASTRGRGTARVSNSSSRATSNVSSHAGGGGRLMLDPGSLQALGSHFERLMGAIERKVDSVRPDHNTISFAPWLGAYFPSPRVDCSVSSASELNKRRLTRRLAQRANLSLDLLPTLPHF